MNEGNRTVHPCPKRGCLLPVNHYGSHQAPPPGWPSWWNESDERGDEVPRHRKRASRRRPWTLEVRDTRHGSDWRPYPEWTAIRRFTRHRREDRARWLESRLVDPNGVVFAAPEETKP